MQVLNGLQDFEDEVSHPDFLEGFNISLNVILQCLAAVQLQAEVDLFSIFKIVF